MRATLSLNLTFTDSETQIIETRAFEARKPLSIWAKELLLSVAREPQRPAESPAVAAPAAQPAAIETRAPAPALEPPEPPEPAPDAEREIEAPARQEAAIGHKRKRTPKELIPRGFDRILEIGQALIKGREEAEAFAGQRFGSVYNRRMRDWYQQNGFIELGNNYRVVFSNIGQNAPAIREWAKTKRFASDISPHTLWQAWEDEPKKPAPPPEPETAPEVAAPPSDETIVIEDGKFKKRRLSEVVGNGAAGPPESARATPSVAPQAEPKFRSFAEVDLDKLPASDGRVLRRFTQRIANLGEAIAALSEEKLALAMRKIRGSEKGDNPPSARSLVRLGVVVGRSGVYKLRPEYVHRFSDVRSWALE